MRTPLEIPAPTAEELDALNKLYRTTKHVRLRTRAQLVRLSAEQHLTAPAIAAIVREDDQTVRRWLKRYLAEGIEGLKDRPMPGAPPNITTASEEQVLAAVRRRPRSLGQPYSMGTLQRLADYMAEQTGMRASDETVRQGREIGRDRAEPSAAQDDQPRSRVPGKKKTSEDARDGLKAGEVFYYADEFNLSWFPTWRAMWSPKGQQVMIPTPGQPDTYDGIGAVNDHTGATVVLFRLHKRRREIAELLQALLDKHPTGTIYVAWDNASMHEDEEIEAVVRAAAGRLVLLYLPTYSPWLNPIEMRLPSFPTGSDAL